MHSAPEGFYFQASNGSVALPVAGYDYNSDWTPLLAGLSPAGMAASLAAPDRAVVALCRADWVRNDPVLTRAAGCYATTTQFLRELREAMRQRASIQGVSLMGPGQEGAIAGRPAHDHWMNSPSSGRIQPTIRL
jgi:hypothetical protein